MCGHRQAQPSTQDRTHAQSGHKRSSTTHVRPSIPTPTKVQTNRIEPANQLTNPNRPRHVHRTAQSCAFPTLIPQQARPTHPVSHAVSTPLSPPSSPSTECCIVTCAIVSLVRLRPTLPAARLHHQLSLSLSLVALSLVLLPSRLKVFNRT